MSARWYVVDCRPCVMSSVLNAFVLKKLEEVR